MTPTVRLKMPWKKGASHGLATKVICKSWEEKRKITEQIFGNSEKTKIVLFF